MAQGPDVINGIEQLASKSDDDHGEPGPKRAQWLPKRQRGEKKDREPDIDVQRVF